MSNMLRITAALFVVWLLLFRVLPAVIGYATSQEETASQAESSMEADVFTTMRDAFFERVRNGKDFIPADVVIDAGHGGEASGAIRSDVMEKDLTLAMAQKTKALLEEAGYTVVMTREEDVFMTLDDRVRLANRCHDAVFVSIHVNALDHDTKTSGIEGFCTADAHEDNQRLAKQVWEHTIDATGANKKKLVTQSGLFIRDIRIPACLLETGFITSNTEFYKLTDPAYQDLIAAGICDGIIAFFENPDDGAVSEEDTDEEADSGDAMTETGDPENPADEDEAQQTSEE